MYICKVKITNEWSKLEDLIQNQVEGQSSFSFSEGTTYQLQAEGNYGVRLCDSSTTPAEAQDGERIEGTQTAIYEVSDGYLYVRPEENIPSGNVWLKISSLGQEVKMITVFNNVYLGQAKPEQVGGHFVKKPTVVEDLTSTSITVSAKANTIYKYGTLSSLNITANETSDEEILIYFTSGASCTVSFPNTLQWVNEDVLEPEANTKYVISIINNIAAYGSYNQGVAL